MIKDVLLVGIGSFVGGSLRQPQYRKKPSEILLRNEALEVFKQWTAKSDKTEY